MKKISKNKYDRLLDEDYYPLLGGPGTASNSPVQGQIDDLISLKILEKLIKDFNNFLSKDVSYWHHWLDLDKDFKKLMTEQIEVYRNVIEAEYGVKLCVKENKNSDHTTMELLVPNKLFADDKGKESLAEALHNIAMFILSLDGTK